MEFGFDEPHFEMNDQGYSGYSLVQSLKLECGRLSIKLTDKGRRVMQVDEGLINVGIDSNLDLTQFKVAMRAIFGEDRFRCL